MKALPPIKRESLIHIYTSTMDQFLQSVSDTGGWPDGYTHVSFFHDGPGGNRYCMFTTVWMQTEWWTTVATIDDYLWYKISPERKSKIEKAARQKMIDEIRRLA